MRVATSLLYCNTLTSCVTVAVLRCLSVRSHCKYIVNWYTNRQNSAGSAAGLDGLGSEDEEDADNDNDNDADNDSQDEGQDQLSAVDQQQQQADGDGTGNSSSSSSSGYANSSSATAAVAAGERKARWLRKRAATQVSHCIGYCVLYVATVVVSRVWPLSFELWS
jgi:cobalamin biosynthesis Mg chelatase CobN